MSDAKIILEGSYLFYENDISYCQENFKVVTFAKGQNTKFLAEVLARTEQGEFLKILVKIELNHQNYPVALTIERSLGKRFGLEDYKLDLNRHELNYQFKNTQSEQQHRSSFNVRSFLTSPAISTSFLFTLSKKWDPTGRTPLYLMNTQNDWTYLAPPSEKTVFVEYRPMDLDKFNISGVEYNATSLSLYEHDTSSNVPEEPARVLFHKQFGIPFEVKQGSRRIVISSLKDHQSLK